MQRFTGIAVFCGSVIEVNINDFIGTVQLIKTNIQCYLLSKIPPAAQFIVIVAGWFQHRYLYPPVQFRNLWRGKTHTIISVKSLSLQDIIGKADFRTEI